MSAADKIIDTDCYHCVVVFTVILCPTRLLLHFPVPVLHGTRNKGFQSLSPCLASCLLIQEFSSDLRYQIGYLGDKMSIGWMRMERPKHSYVDSQSISTT